VVQNLLSLWQSFDARRRFVIIGATLAVFLAVLGLSRMAATPEMTLLYAGLNSSAAGEVVASLDQRGVVYEVRGDSIYVDDTQRDSLRMTLAAEGLPANGGTGYEILDGLSGFGTTSQMFDAAYWRAKEGEMARTILANPEVRAARVHIAQAPSQPFQRDVHPTASITVTSLNGGLSAMQAKAIRHLVAAAVPGMRPDDVSVIDTIAGLIASETDAAIPGASGESRAAEIKRNVERLLSARVGPGNAVVEVTVDVVTDRESVTERRFDPQGRVAISSETQQKTGSNTDPGGDVTVASNLPEGAAAGSSGKSETSEARETVNYEVSETNREILRVPGAVRKLSLAVLIDGQTTTAADGTTTQAPRSEEELAILRELVASAVGLDEARGDILTLKSLDFLPDAPAGEFVEAGMISGAVDVMSLIQMAVLAMVVLVLGLFVIRPMLTSARHTSGLPASAPTLSLPGMATSDAVLTGEIDDDGEFSNLALVASGEDPARLETDPAARLRRLIEERQAESVEILRGWMELEEERG
jgi:flagellar M-ring protein FliF